MEAAESPLEVLSRAATMVQENQQAMTTAEDCSKQPSTKQLPTTKWKRDRRSRLPEYSRKSDPKIPEVFEQAAQDAAETNGGAPNGHHEMANGKNPADAPLDMSIRPRGQPPSYAATVSNPGYRSSYRPSVIQNSVAPRDDIPSGISMCDPIIDEHFRRSLGNDYLALFSNNNVAKEPADPCRSRPQRTNGDAIELMDNAGLSVDDHFAKALGDTWLKLNKKDPDMKGGSTEGHSMVSI